MRRAPFACNSSSKDVVPLLTVDRLFSLLLHVPSHHHLHMSCHVSSRMFTSSRRQLLSSQINPTLTRSLTWLDNTRLKSYMDETIETLCRSNFVHHLNYTHDGHRRHSLSQNFNRNAPIKLIGHVQRISILLPEWVRLLLAFACRGSRQLTPWVRGRVSNRPARSSKPSCQIRKSDYHCGGAMSLGDSSALTLPSTGSRSVWLISRRGWSLLLYGAC